MIKSKSIDKEKTDRKKTEDMKEGALSPRFSIRVILYYLVAAVIIAVDQAVKRVVASNMYPGQSIPLINDALHITYVRNQGAAFSMWQQQWVILIVLPAVVLIAALVLICIKGKTWHPCILLSVSFICGGGIGNVVDRISQGYVVDFLDCRFIPFMDFPVFNIADIFVCVGCGLLLFYVIFVDGKKEDTAKEKKSGEHRD